MTDKSVIIYQHSRDDTRFLPYLKGVVGDVSVRLNSQSPTLVMEAVIRCKQVGTKLCMTSDEKFLNLLLGKPDKWATLDAYSGSIIEKFGIEFLIIPPLEWIVTLSYGKFLHERYISKFVKPTTWMSVPKFEWNLFEPAQEYSLRTILSSCDLISIDIETIRDDPDRNISCVGFSGIKFDFISKQFTVTTVVVPFTCDFNLAFIRTICELKIPKVFQNGKYDIAYLLRFGVPITNYAFDTANLFHSWYSELPKDLGMLSGFFIRDYIYHKDENSSGNLMEHYRYNAKDCFYTAIIWISMMLEAPKYAWDNYFQEFPVVFPCILAEHTPLRIDLKEKERISVQLKAKKAEALDSLRTMVANSAFNPGSPPQTALVFAALGSGDIKGTGKIPRDKCAARHPLNKRIMDGVEEYRKAGKLDSSYSGKDFLWYDDKCFYSLHPHGTDTGRLAAKESAFWTGLAIQTIPRNDDGQETSAGVDVKDMFIPEPGFLFFECDYSQNEAWFTAFLSGDTALIEAITDHSKDFHGRNASAFFGLEYSEIMLSYQDELGHWIHKALNKPVRQLSKNTNHGVSYNMMAQMLVDTMGIKNVLRAKRLLKLPAAYTLVQVTQYMLDRYDETYPVVRGESYDAIKNEVNSTGLMVGPTGWTRRCFSNPSKSKRALNMYAAQRSQSPAAMVLNKCYRRVFNEVALANPRDFRMGPQIHDSILGQYRIGREDLAYQVQECMKTITPVTDIYGITRDLTVPTDLKLGGTAWSKCA